MAKTDAEILDGSPIDITFNGTTYTWRPLNRRKQRRVRARLMGIMAIAADAQSSGEMVKASVGMEATAMVLEFCEDYHPVMAEDMDSIDDYIDSNPQEGFVSVMRDIFNPLFEAWLKPWLSMDDESGDSKKKTNTKSPRSTKD